MTFTGAGAGIVEHLWHYGMLGSCNKMKWMDYILYLFVFKMDTLQCYHRSILVLKMASDYDSDFNINHRFPWIG